MSCIFYQDELGICCINGLDWSDGFSNNPRCLEDAYEEKVCDRGKITITDAREMKRKLDGIQKLLTGGFMDKRTANQLRDILSSKQKENSLKDGGKEA